jgi:pyruvate-formate lyase-activating enzyme
MHISQISLGFIDLPDTTTINIFAKGCRHKCPGCSNAQLQKFSKKECDILDSKNFEYYISSPRPLTNWICWLGGDPVYQSKSFIELTRIAWINRYYNALYTGFKFKTKAVQNVIEYVDIVIDGKWKGVPITDPKSNQKIYIRKGDEFIVVPWAELKNHIKEREHHVSASFI